VTLAAAGRPTAPYTSLACSSSHSSHPRYYARYLLTFTFTQLVDISLWWLHEEKIPGGLQACVPYQIQFGWAPWDSPQFPNFVISKFVLPLVVFSQHATQLMYPSDKMNGPNERRNLILLHLLPVVGMSFAFACTYLVPSFFPVEQPTLHWGGDFTMWPWAMIQVAAAMHSGLVAYGFTLVMPFRVALVHIVPLVCVIATLAITEGTVELGSKWCTYCLIYSFVYIAEPLWCPVEYPAGVKARTKGKSKRA
jgi:hypothetical protein